MAKKAEKQEIVIDDTLKVVHVDSMNWQLFEKKEITRDNRRGGKSRVGEVDWMPLPAFFGTLRPALAKARDIYRERKLDAATLDEAVKQLEALDRKFVREVKKAVG